MTNDKDVRTEMVQYVTGLNDDDLDREVSFAEGFGPDADPNAPLWMEVLVQEKQRRSESA